MVNVTAATSFFGTSQEGMWRAGDTRRVSAHRANELIEEGLAIESRDQSEPAETSSPVQQVADAIGATFAEPADSNLPAVAEAIGATVAEKPVEEVPPVTLDSLKKEEKHKRETKEEKAKRETKEAK